MEFRYWTIGSSVAGALCVAATSTMAQVGNIPGRNDLYHHGHDMMWGGTQWGGFGMVLGPIFMILIVVGIVAGIIYLLRLFGVAGPAVGSHAAHDRALALLKERYAKGEIDSAEFAERKKLLAD
ncbi:SHOCT domain-containing protein [Puniceibacterium confluentis]|uniref:SHOCT domain-containing protein n=1 Tax=Puniceibacterium confluentis TaxID=1958944 RepID=UPI001C961155|nr:SHOCT domain-containing protein [Puniceibacterium confluentis]